MSSNKLIWALFIGQFVYHHFIRAHENLKQHPSNNILIFQMMSKGYDNPSYEGNGKLDAYGKNLNIKSIVFNASYYRQLFTDIRIKKYRLKLVLFS